MIKIELHWFTFEEKKPQPGTAVFLYDIKKDEGIIMNYDGEKFTYLNIILTMDQAMKEFSHWSIPIGPKG